MNEYVQRYAGSGDALKPLGRPAAIGVGCSPGYPRQTSLNNSSKSSSSKVGGREDGPAADIAIAEPNNLTSKRRWQGSRQGRRRKRMQTKKGKE